VNLPAYSCQRTLALIPSGAPTLAEAPSFRRAGDPLRLPQKDPIKYETRRRAPGTTTVPGGSARCSTFLPCANKAPHYRICSLDHFRPDCESPARFDTFRKGRTICNLTPTIGYVKQPAEDFSPTFHTLWKLRKNAFSWASRRRSMRGFFEGLHNPQQRLAVHVLKRKVDQMGSRIDGDGMSVRQVQITQNLERAVGFLKNGDVP